MTALATLFGMKERKFRDTKHKYNQLIGIELELENVHPVKAIPYWMTVPDGSLREGVEYVLDQAYAGDTLMQAVDEYYDADLRFNNTSRTSTHIHLNMTDATVAELRVMSLIMYAIEDSIFAAVDGDRKWTGYAMALSEMEPVRLRNIMSLNDDAALVVNIAPARNQERYYGFNTASMRKHGTVEFRYFPGGPTKEELIEWLDWIVRLKNWCYGKTPDGVIDSTPTAEALLVKLEEAIGRPWLDKLLAVTPIEYMLERFNSIAALTTDPEPFTLNNNVVYLVPPLMTYLGNTVFGEEAMKYMQLVAKKAPAVSLADWNYHYEEALHKGQGDRQIKPKTAKPKPPALADWLNVDAFARPRDDAADQAIEQLRRFQEIQGNAAADQMRVFTQATPPRPFGGARPAPAPQRETYHAPEPDVWADLNDYDPNNRG